MFTNQPTKIAPLHSSSPSAPRHSFSSSSLGISSERFKTRAPKCGGRGSQSMGHGVARPELRWEGGSATENWRAWKI